MLLNEDYHHVIPARAWLKWRENWIYFLCDPEEGIFVTVHMSLLPTENTMRWSCNLVIDGERTSYADYVDYDPANFNNPKLKVGAVVVEFIKPQQEIKISVDAPDHKLELHMEATMPLFDYQASHDANPEHVSLSENTGMGFGEFRHQNQTMKGRGKITFKSGPAAGTSREFGRYGYRDHSWGMRDDNMTLTHVWAWLSFPGWTAHVTRVRNLYRPDVWSLGGYLGRPEGNLALVKMDAELVGESADEMPAYVLFDIVASDGQAFTVKADLTNAYARNRFLATRPGKQGYVMRHNFVRCVREDTGEEGFSMVEIGVSQEPETSTLSSGKSV